MALIYLDNAATGWPKPPAVMDAMISMMTEAGGSPGRSGHALSVEAGRRIFEARELIARLFNAPDPMGVIFTLNTTHALNLALRGLLNPGDRVVTTSMEHNSVMRPLRALAADGVELEVIACNQTGALELSLLQDALRRPARLVVVNHASNVVGTLQDIRAVARMAREAGALFLLDAAQSAGAVPIDMEADGIDLLAFTGHKGLMGPQGTGGLVLGRNVDVKQIRPLILGGTGSNSGHEAQPDRLPDRFESGTPNGPGIAGLAAGVRRVLEMGIEQIREHEIVLTQMLIDGLDGIDGVYVHGTRRAENSAALVSISIDGMQCSDIGFLLEEEYGILCRTGLHCAPAAHKTISTYPEGTVRLSPGPFTTEDEIGRAVEAVRAVVKR